jgi:hypothetical protein
MHATACLSVGVVQHTILSLLLPCFGHCICMQVGPEGQPQSLVVLDKRADGELVRQDLMDVQYVPLTSADHQLRTER